MFIKLPSRYLLIIIFSGCILHSNIHLFSQKKAVVPAGSIKAIGSADSCKCAIRLRWSLTDPYAWKLGNTYGYTIDRYTILRNGQIITVPNKKRITPTPLKPRPQKEWEILCQTDDNAAIVAQGLYGEDFEVTGGNSKLARIVNQNNSLTQRFTFTLVAADRSFKAACMAGLGWRDSTVHADEKYLYRIYPNVPAEKLKCDTALVYIGSGEAGQLPKPVDVYVVYGDKSVMLSWDGKLLKDFYSSYLIERSEDGTHFALLSQLPFTTLNDASEKESGRVFYMDTIRNNRQFSYRIKGITPFGEYGPASDPVKGAGQAMMAYAPNIRDAQIINDSTAVISWEFPEEGAAVVDHFELYRSPNNADNSFTRVMAQIAPSQREVQYAPLLPSNYFTIAAVDKNGNQRSSFSYLVQPVDSIPPAVPSGLTATIDSLGKLTLQWQANREPDLLGYVILKGNNRTEEKSVINSVPLKTNRYEEKIPLNDLNSKIYYSVMALDRRMNQSKPCPPVEVSKPDKIPPTPPVLSDYRITGEGKIILNWINSSSEDVVTHLLLRKTEQDTAWTTVATITDLQTTRYEDTPPAPSAGGFLSYTACAIDRSHNLSDFSPVLKVMPPAAAMQGRIKNLRADSDRNTRTITISWKTDSPDIVEYTLYKARNKEPLTTLQVLPGRQQYYTDTDVAINNTYRYAVRPSLKNGKYGEWKEVKTDY